MNYSFVGNSTDLILNAIIFPTLEIAFTKMLLKAFKYIFRDGHLLDNINSIVNIYFVISLFTLFFSILFNAMTFDTLSLWRNIFLRNNTRSLALIGYKTIIHFVQSYLSII
ncbi:hypothetical protein ACJX0J_013194 [Zea mays]